MQKRTQSNKRALQKALKERLERLTLSLGQAQVGDKGIELIKEMKELCALLENATPEVKTERNISAQSHTMTFTWATPQEPNSAPESPQNREETA